MVAVAGGEATGAAPSAFFRVLEAPGLLSKCTAYQDGEGFLEYDDGDVAAAQGHLSLLRLRRALLLSSLRQDGKNSVDDGRSSVESKQVDDGGSRREEEQINEGSSSSGGEAVDDGCSSSREREEVDESDQDGGVAAGRGGEREEGGREKMVSRDLRFSHRAADWAATQGHLEVVRSVGKGGEGASLLQI